MCLFWAPHWWAAAQPHWPSANEAAGTTGLEPNTDTNVMWVAIIGAKTGFTPDPIDTHANVATIRIGPKAIVMAAIGKKAVVTAGIGTGVIDTGATGKKVIVMGGIGTGPGIIATTADAMRPLPAITDMAGITTGTRHATA